VPDSIRTIVSEDGALELEIHSAVADGNWDRVDELSAEQLQLGSPCFSFVHSFTEQGPPRDVLLHPKMICDSVTVIAFGRIYLEHVNTRREL
jgi:hypothetical protein